MVIMQKFIVYMHEHRENGKKYIGITCRKPEHRWSNGKGYVSNSRFTRAIKKYGWDAFNHYILYADLTKEEACKKEIELIAKYKTTNDKYGYNISPGGEATMLGVRHTDEAKRKIGEAGRGRQGAWKGKHLPESAIIKKSKPIICVETGTRYISAKSASKETGVHYTSICECANGSARRQTAGGYHWKWVRKDQ